MADGWVIVTDITAVQLFASVVVTVYVPAARPERSCVVAPPVQEYVYGMEPPVTVRSIEPVEDPLHSTFTCVSVRLGPPVLFTVADVVFVQLFASDTVTVYVPADTLLRFCVVAPFDHTYV